MSTLQPHAAYKDSGIEWLGNIPASWEVRRLRSVAELAASNVDKVSSPDEQLVRLCNYTDVYKNPLIRDDMPFMNGTATPEEIAKFSLRGGEVLFTKDSEAFDDIGIPAVAAEGLENVIVGYHLMMARPRRELSGHYLAWFFTPQVNRWQFEVSAKGVTRFGMPQSGFKDALIPLPSLDEQRAIADFLDAMDERISRFIAARRKMIGLLEEEKRAVIHHAVTRGLNPDVPMKDSRVDWLGEIPAHWEISRIRTCILDSVAGIWGEEPTIANGHDHIWCIRVADFHMPSLRITATKKTMRAVAVSARTPRLLSKGDILLEKSGGGDKQPVGRAVMFDSNEPAVTSNFVTRIRPDRSLVLPEFLLFMMEALQAARITQLSIKQTTGIQNLDERKYLSNRVPVPGLDDQQSIVEHINADTSRIDAASSRHRREIELMQEYLTRLISEVVSGKLDVRGVELGKLPEFKEIPEADELIDVVDASDELLEESTEGVMA